MQPTAGRSDAQLQMTSTLPVEIIQKQPATDAARMADYQVSRHQGFMANLPRLR